MDVIIKGVYDEEELNRDYRNAMKRINKTLNHMKQQGLVLNCGEELLGNIWLTCWQLVDKEVEE